ncbi:MAG: hypothetical protein M3487_04940, partial [Actinomycetota bacterium]|nr:hypothetical protein [Actinomycetota bacterium]
MTFAPIVGWWALAAVTAVVLALCIGGLRRAPRRRLAWARRAMIVGFLAALAARPGAADAESTGLVTDLDVY